MTTIWSQEFWKQTFLKTKKYNRWKLIDDWTKWVVFPTKSVPIHLCATKHRKVNGLHISFSPPPFGYYCKMCFCSLLSPYFPIFPKRKMLKEMDFICCKECSSHVQFSWTELILKTAKKISGVCEKATNFQLGSHYYFLI